MNEDGITAEIPAGSTPARLYPESPTHFFVLDGPQELTFSVDSQDNVTGVDFIVPLGGHHPLEKSAAH